MSFDQQACLGAEVNFSRRTDIGAVVTFHGIEPSELDIFLFILNLDMIKEIIGAVIKRMEIGMCDCSGFEVRVVQGLKDVWYNGGT